MVDGQRTQKRERHSIRATPFPRSFVHILPVVAVKRVVQYSHACYSLTHPLPMSTSRAACVGADEREREWKVESATVEMIQSSPFIFIQFYSRGGLGWKARWTRIKKRRKNCILHSVNVKSWSTKEWSIRSCMIPWSTNRARKVYKVEGESCAVKISREKKTFTNGHIHQHSDTEYHSGWISSIGRGPLWRFIVIPWTRKKKLKGSYRDEIVHFIFLVFSMECSGQ